MTKKQIKTVKRNIENGIIILCILSSLIMSGIIVYNKLNNKSDMQVKAITIAEGDTLWDLQSKYSSSQNDINKLIYETKEYNNIDKVESLKIGDTIYIVVD